MARRTPAQSTPSTTPEVPQEEIVTTTPEATVEAPTTEATKADDKKADKPFDLTAFKEAAKVAASTADTSTGEIAVAQVEPVVKEYRELDGLKAKNAAKGYLNDEMKAQMKAGSIVGARSYLQLAESMTAGTKTAEKVPADPTEAFVQAEATLRLAQELHVPGEGVAEDNEEKVLTAVESNRDAAASYLAWVQSDAEDKGDEPEVTAIVKNAVKLAIGKAAKAGGRSNAGGTFTGERRDIAKHIQEAFADKEVGEFMLIAEIRNFKSSEYGENLPSAGAISARLFPKNAQGEPTKCTVEGVEPQTNEKGNNGAAKTA
jgi:hypothetical protein